MKTTVTEKDVLENMEDVVSFTTTSFNKPIAHVVVRMKNGFTLQEASTCVDPNNYSEDIGREICLEKIKDKVWFLLGYQLQEDIYRSNSK